MAQRPGKYVALPGYITSEAFGIAFRQGEDSLRAEVQKDHRRYDRQTEQWVKSPASGSVKMSPNPAKW